MKREWSGTRCTVRACENVCKRMVLGYGPVCSAHHQRWRKDGDVRPEQPLRVVNHTRTLKGEWSRQCPQCGTLISYRAESSAYHQARKRNSTCRECHALNSRGDGNPFSGKTHTAATRLAIGVKARGQRHSPATEFKKGVPTSNSRPIYACWVDRYGVEDADRRLEDFKRKQSIAHSGARNNMFGKPAPQGSGNGWAGWYRGLYFRSLHELSYIINVLEATGTTFESAEQRKYRVTYRDWCGKERTYYADFVVNGTVVVECKPERLHDTPSVQTKARAATAHFKAMGLDYRLIAPPLLSDDALKSLYLSGCIAWLPRYQARFEERYSA